MKKILVIIDVQNDFINGSLCSKEAQKIIPNVVDKIREHKNCVIFCTRDTHFENYLDTREGKMLPIKHCIKGTHGWEIHSDILKELEGTDYQIIDKNIFGSIELAEKIKNLIDNFSVLGVKNVEIELVGLVTNICVISNALLLRAYLPNIKITVDSNCCAGSIGNAGDNLSTHMAALNIMADNDIEIRNL